MCRNISIMKLTIDTKEDSHEEIKKAIKMLATIVGDEKVYTNSAPKAAVANIFDTSGSMTTETAPAEPVPGSVFGNMFGEPSPTTETTEPSEDKKEEDETPQVIVEY